jgi:hypothetical protein
LKANVEKGRRRDGEKERRRGGEEERRRGGEEEREAVPSGKAGTTALPPGATVAALACCDAGFA